jgi:4-hydroxy-tetrahydrodipicolinate synthase
MFLTLRQGQIIRAQRLSHPITQLTAALFRETNPAPVKFALSLFGLMAPWIRLPLVEIGEKAKSELAGIVARLCNDWSASMIGRMGKPLGAWRHAS